MTITPKTLEDILAAHTSSTREELARAVLEAAVGSAEPVLWQYRVFLVLSKDWSDWRGIDEWDTDEIKRCADKFPNDWQVRALYTKPEAA